MKSFIIGLIAIIFLTSCTKEHIQSPKAVIAGINESVVTVNGQSTREITFDATGSIAPGQAIITYTWIFNGQYSFTSAQAKSIIPDIPTFSYLFVGGTFTIELVITDQTTRTANATIVLTL